MITLRYLKIRERTLVFPSFALVQFSGFYSIRLPQLASFRLHPAIAHSVPMRSRKHSEIIMMKETPPTGSGSP